MSTSLHRSPAELRRELADKLMSAATSQPLLWDAWSMIARVRVLQIRAEQTNRRADRIAARRAAAELDALLVELNLMYAPDGPRRCRICGCTDADCRQCVERTGRPCCWVGGDLCSACVGRAGEGGAA